MTRYWLRVEGQNRNAFIFDTQDLSTIRGGSMALLDVIEELPRALKGKGVATRLTLVSTGASIGVWSFDADEGTARQIAQDSASVLTHGDGVDSPFAVSPHTVFHVGVVADARGDYVRDHEKLVAIARRAELARAGVIYPADDAASPGVCPVNRILPTSNAKRMFWKDPKTALSPSVHSRRKYGLDAKQEFAENLVGAPPAHPDSKTWGERPFALQINSISESAEPPRLLRPNLSDKIAVLYFDGNSFGELFDDFMKQGGTAAADERHTKFDEYVKGRRNALLKALLTLVDNEQAIGPPSPEETQVRNELSDTADKVIRFEMMLWGGDEFMVIMPARLGWEALECALKDFETWELPDYEGKRQPMRHAAGLVFCHHDAPIARIRDLAKRLAEHAKDTTRDATRADRPGREHNLAMALTLESFDVIGHDLDAFLARRVPADGQTPSEERNPYFVLDKTEVLALRQAAKKLRGDGSGESRLSRSLLRRLAHAVYRPGKSKGGKNTYALLKERVRSDTGRDLGATDTDEDMKAIFARVDGRGFVLLEEFCDYLVPLRYESEAP